MQRFGRTCVALALLMMSPAAALADMVEQLSGKTLVAGKNRIEMGADGSMSGKVGSDRLVGTWMVKDGKFCRTIKEPARMAGTECHSAVLRGNTLRITRADGSTLEWSVQ